MRIKFCNWKIEKEKQLGFADEAQRDSILEAFDRMLESAKSPPDKMPLPAPQGYSVDAIVNLIELEKMFGQFGDDK